MIPQDRDDRGCFNLEMSFNKECTKIADPEAAQEYTVASKITSANVSAKRGKAWGTLMRVAYSETIFGVNSAGFTEAMTPEKISKNLHMFGEADK